VQYRSCVYFTEILILFVVEYPLRVDSHKSLTTFTSKDCWVDVILATTSVVATSGGCRLSATIGFVSDLRVLRVEEDTAISRQACLRYGNAQSAEVL
jgi:hypothetical protein